VRKGSNNWLQAGVSVWSAFAQQTCISKGNGESLLSHPRWRE
jgi:hypothetical protein